MKKNLKKNSEFVEFVMTVSAVWLIFSPGLLFGIYTNSLIAGLISSVLCMVMYVFLMGKLIWDTLREGHPLAKAFSATVFIMTVNTVLITLIFFDTAPHIIKKLYG